MSTDAKTAGESFTIEFFMGSPDDNDAVMLYNGVMEVLQPYLDAGTLVCKSGRTVSRIIGVNIKGAVLLGAVTIDILSKRKKVIRLKKYTYKHSLNEKYCACERC